MTKELLDAVNKEAERQYPVSMSYKNDIRYDSNAPRRHTFESGASFMHGLMEGEVQELKKENDSLTKTITIMEGRAEHGDDYISNL